MTDLHAESARATESASAGLHLFQGENEAEGPGSDTAPREHSLKRTTVANTAWQLGSHLVQNIARFGGNITLAHLVPPSLFGLSAVVTYVMMGLEMISDVGIGPSVVQNPRGEQERFLRTAWTIQIIRGGLLFLLGLALAWPVSLYTGERIHLFVVPIAAVVALIEGFRSTGWYRLQRRLRMLPIAAIQTGASLLTVILMIGWAFVSPTIWALVVPVAISALLQMLFSHLFLRDRPDRLGLYRTEASEILSFGGWIFFSSALSFLASTTDKLFLARLGMAELGIYNIAFMLATIPTQLLLRLGMSVIFPAYASVKQDPARFAAVFHKIRLPLVLMGSYATAGLVGAGRSFIEAVYPADYHAAGWMLQILAIAGWFQVLQTPNDAALLATGRSKWAAVGQAGKFLTLVVGLFIGYWQFGLMGVVVAVAIAEAAKYLLNALMMRRLRLSSFVVDLALIAAITATGAAAVTLSGLIDNAILRFVTATLIVTVLWAPAALPVWRLFKGKGV